MRLDKYIADTGIASRKECAKAARAGLVILNGAPVKDVSVHIDENTAQVIYCGKKVEWQKYIYLMLNKPSGYISSSDGDSRSIMRLLPERWMHSLAVDLILTQWAFFLLQTTGLLPTSCLRPDITLKKLTIINAPLP